MKRNLKKLIVKGLNMFVIFSLIFFQQGGILVSIALDIDSDSNPEIVIVPENSKALLVEENEDELKIDLVDPVKKVADPAPKNKEVPPIIEELVVPVVTTETAVSDDKSVSTKESFEKKVNLSGQECLDKNDKIKNSEEKDWNINEEKGIAETRDDVELGVKYIFPLDEKVSVTFSCLPKDPEKRDSLKIEQIRTADLNLPNGTVAAGEYAYDITTGMENGDFEYDVTLPKAGDFNSDVSYIEKSVNDAKQEVKSDEINKIDENKVEKKNEIIEVSDLDHFTIYLVTWNFPENNDNEIADGGTSANLAKTIASVGTNTPIFNVNGASTKSASATGWDNGSGLKYWKVELNSQGFESLVLSSKQYSSATGPKDFKVQYSTDGSSWVDVSGGDVTVATNFTTGIVLNLTLPLAVNDQNSVYLKWVMTSDTAVDGSSVGSSGTSRIDDIVVRGVRSNMLPGLNDMLCIDEDTDGANDFSGQKDLTKFCRNIGDNNPLKITWNWDDISMSGGNTADACALFDVDHIGDTGYDLADYAICVSWGKEGKIISGYPKLYSCNDTRPNGCAGAVELATPSQGTYCDVSLSDEDPFSTGNNSPFDMQAYCSIDPADTGGESASDFIDVCSYPSGEPGSAPSDCIAMSLLRGNLQVNKNVVPDDASTNWDINVSGATPFSDTLQGDATTGTRVVDTGTYDISEAAGSDTDMNQYDSSYSCLRNGSAFLSGTGTSISGISVARADFIQCTFTNTLKTGTVVVHKDVQGPNGEDITDVSNNFTIQLDGDNSETVIDEESVIYANVLAGVHTISEINIPNGYELDSITNEGSVVVNAGETTDVYVVNKQKPTTLTLTKTVVNNNGGTKQVSDFVLKIDNTEVTSGVANAVTPGNYIVSEINLPGYTASSWSGDCDADGEVTLALGENKTCTITNDDQPAHLIVIKHVDNSNGGSESAGNFTMTINGITVEDGQASFAGEEAPGTDKIVYPGSYSVTESGPEGYQQDNASDDCSGIIALGQTKTCTITNGDLPATLIVKKHVINDNGGNALASDFTMNVTGTNVSDDSFAGSEEGTSITLNAGSYSVSEDIVDGYNESIGASCSGIIANGETKICTITNNDVAPTITLIKSVTNDNGGKDGANDFGISVGDTSVLSGSITTVESNTPIAIDEAGLAGYEFVSITGDEKCPQVLGETVALNEGEDISCTINNNDIFGKIIIEKQTLPDGDDQMFTFKGELSGTIGDGGQLEKIVVPGSYSVSENETEGWDLTDITCDDVDSTQNATAGYTVDLNVDANETVKCIFTNTKRGELVIAKNTVGGDETFDFDVTTGELNPGNFSIKTSNGEGERTFHDVLPGNSYGVSEKALSGWDLTSASCDRGIIDDIEVLPGETITCVFTNTKVGQIIVDKITNPSGDEQSFDFSTTGEGYNSFSLTDLADPNNQSLRPGAYTVAENTVSGWDLTDINCSSQETPVPVEGNNVCHKTGSEAHPWNAISVPANNHVHEGHAEDYPYAGPVDKNGHPQPQIGEQWCAEHVEDIQEAMSEAVVQSESQEAEVVSQPITIDLSAGEIVTCTFINTKRGSIDVTKYNDKNGNGTQDEGEEVMSDWNITLDEMNAVTDENGKVSFDDLIPNKGYVLGETMQEGWKQTNVACEKITKQEENNDLVNVLVDELGEKGEISIDNDNNYQLSLLAGDVWNCSIGNQFVEPELQIEKTNDATENKKPGDTVKYTLKITAPEKNSSAVKNVKVTDLPPVGFKYQAGSAEASQGSLAHEYASPGIWELGDINPGEEVILSYNAVISGDQETGVHRDLAYALGETLLGDQVLVNENETNPYFIGTEVSVIKPIVATIVEIPEETETETKTKRKVEKVLGATTYLPTTGTNSLWLIVAFALFILGSIFIVFALKKKKILNSIGNIMKMFIFMIFMGILVFSGGNARAAVQDKNIAVQLTQPKSPNTNNFEIGFVVLDVKGRNLKVECYNEVNLFETVDIIPGGTSGVCKVDEKVVPVDGFYDFHIKAVADDGNYNYGASVTVEVIKGRPGTPMKYDRDEDSCSVTFTTANDEGQTAKVILYRSTENSFIADDSTKVDEIAIGSNTNGSINDPSLSCGKDYFYVIRAFNKADNGSEFIGDEDIEIKTKTRTRTTTRVVNPIVYTTGAIPVEGEENVIVGGDEGEEEETTIAGESVGQEEVEVEGSQSENNGASKWLWKVFDKWPWILLAVVILLVPAYLLGVKHFFKKSGKENE